MGNEIGKDLSEISTNLESIYLDSKIAIITLSNQLLPILERMEKENTTILLTKSHLKDSILNAKVDAERCLIEKMKNFQHDRKSTKNRNVNQLKFPAIVNNERLYINENGKCLKIMDQNK